MESIERPPRFGFFHVFVVVGLGVAAWTLVEGELAEPPVMHVVPVREADFERAVLASRLPVLLCLVSAEKDLGQPFAKPLQAHAAAFGDRMAFCTYDIDTQGGRPLAKAGVRAPLSVFLSGRLVRQCTLRLPADEPAMGFVHRLVHPHVCPEGKGAGHGQPQNVSAADFERKVLGCDRPAVLAVDAEPGGT